MRVFRTESAESDLDSIAGYYDALNPVATLAMLDAIAETEFLLVEHPQIGRPGRVAGTREAMEGSSPR